MKLNLDKNYIDLEGNPQEVTLNVILANIFANSNTLQPAKTSMWAYDLMKDAEIDIQKEDLSFIRNVISRDQLYRDLPRAQLLEEIDKLKE